MTPVYTQPFDVKHPELLTDKVKGFPALHPDGVERLEFICEVSWANWQIRPVVTEFARTSCDQEAIYAPIYLQSLEHQGMASDLVAREQAEELARRRFSWHCIDTATGHFRAFDIRDWSYLPVQRQEIIRRVREKYPRDEILHHAVPGGSWHFHFGIPDPHGKPHSWV